MHLPSTPPPASPDASAPAERARESLRGPLRVGLLAGAWALLGLAMVDLYLRFSAGTLSPHEFFSADLLYLPTLFRDLFEEGGRWAGWRLTPAPYLFPDMALYFLLDAVSGPFMHAVLAYGVVQLVLWVLAVQLLVRTAAPRGSAAAGQVAGVAVVCALLRVFASGRLSALYGSVLSAIHFSVLLMALVGLALALRFFRDGSRPAGWALAVVCFLMSASDALFVTAFTVPTAVALVVLAGLQHPRPWRRLATVVAMLAVSSLAGFRAARILTRGRAGSGYTRMRAGQVLESLEQLRAAVVGLFHQAPGVVLAWLVLVLAAVCVVVACRRWAEQASPRWGLYAVCLYTVLAVGANTSAVVLTGVFVDAASFRYLLLPIVWPFLAAPLAIGLVPRASWQRALGVGALGAVAVGWGVFIAAHPWQTGAPPLAAHAPRLVECLDANQARYGLGRGVADYWNAKPVSMFSRTGLRVVQVEPDLRPFHWISNVDWYQQRSGPRPEYTFVITQRLDTDLLKKTYGEPRESFRCDDVEVYVYGDGFDAALRASLEAALTKR